MILFLISYSSQKPVFWALVSRVAGAEDIILEESYATETYRSWRVQNHRAGVWEGLPCASSIAEDRQGGGRIVRAKDGEHRVVG